MEGSIDVQGAPMDRGFNLYELRLVLIIYTVPV